MKISVLMSVYKKENPKYFKLAIESILKQTHLVDEIVLIEDGPLTDELNLLIQGYLTKYDKIKVHKFKENVQLGRALAKGVELCNGELIVRMDTDDISVSNRVEMQYNYMMMHPEIDVLGGAIEEFNDDNSYKAIKHMPINHESIVKYARYRNPINHMTAMYRKEAILKAGNYSHFPLLEDYELWSRMIVQGYKFHNLDYVLVKARTNANMYIRRGGIGYLLRYKKLRKVQKSIGLLNLKEYYTSILINLTVIMQPVLIRKFLYRRILRKIKGVNGGKHGKNI